MSFVPSCAGCCTGLAFQKSDYAALWTTASSMPPAQHCRKASPESPASSGAPCLDHASPLPPGLPNSEDQSYSHPIPAASLHAPQALRPQFLLLPPSPGSLSRHRAHGQTTPLCSGELLSGTDAWLMGKAVPAGMFSYSH